MLAPACISISPTATRLMVTGSTRFVGASVSVGASVAGVTTTGLLSPVVGVAPTAADEEEQPQSASAQITAENIIEKIFFFI